MLVSRASSNRSENRLSRRKRTIELTQAPQYPTIGSGISSVQGVTMIQIDRCVKVPALRRASNSRSLCPMSSEHCYVAHRESAAIVAQNPKWNHPCGPETSFPTTIAHEDQSHVHTGSREPNWESTKLCRGLGDSGKRRRRVLAKSATRQGIFQHRWIDLPLLLGRFASEPPCRNEGTATSDSPHR